MSVSLYFQVTTECDFQALSSELTPKENRINDDREEELQRKHPSGLRPVSEGGQDKVYQQPMVILGRDGTIALWYLPGALTKTMQVWFIEWKVGYVIHTFKNHALHSTQAMREVLGTTINKWAWRTDPQFFTTGKTAGCINLSPARWTLGHEVRDIGIANWKHIDSSSVGDQCSTNPIGGYVH